MRRDSGRCASGPAAPSRSGERELVLHSLARCVVWRGWMGRPENVDRNREAMRVQLDDADMAALDTAFPLGSAAGLRSPEEARASLGREAPRT